MSSSWRTMTPEQRERKLERDRNRSPEAQERRRRLQHEHRQLPEVKTQRQVLEREYRQRPEVKERIRERRRARQLRTRGLSSDDRSRMWRDQDGRCAICRIVPATHMDHDHETGLIRALLCHRCNTCLGLADDDPMRLRAAADYLETHRRATRG